MDASDLRIFEAVARLGGINRAAADLNTVQSNVTTRLRLLEEELGVRLFDRGRRGVVLTAAGQRLLPYAYKVRDEIDNARRAVADDGVPRGPMTIGSLETTTAIRLSPILAAYVASNPDVDVTLRADTTAELIQSVLQRGLEGAFVCGPVHHPELIEETIFREELVVMAPPSSRSLDMLLSQSNLRIVVLRAGCSYRQRLEDILARRGIVGLRLLEFGTLEAIFGCVAAGLGVSLLPRALVGPVLQHGRV
ncbi:LysR family transcriptional regulator [Methylocella sp.]|jgi:DNA-binding transcriptional LysR family regulator|uniref:LysR family transcriptional regulator n=1 Tax=Methylocella sp. TaxID=1978226 RepID=UPI003C27B3FF